MIITFVHDATPLDIERQHHWSVSAKPVVAPVQTLRRSVGWETETGAGPQFCVV